ncbi:MAG: DUF2079 domain-containing protein, partial [Bacteroidetes bacterium]|nr:DUF2079 domain-containing protein [Bacteroidota bacterium]
AAILWGGMGVYKYTSERTDLPYLPHVILVFFYSLWGIFAALSFDFHTNILAAMIVPWFIYYLEKGNKKTTIILFVLALLTKENISFWFAFILIGMAFKNRFQLLKTMPVFLIVLFGVSVSYFLIVVGYVMPYLANATYVDTYFCSKITEL